MIPAEAAAAAIDPRAPGPPEHALRQIQEPIRAELDEVATEMWKLVASDAPGIGTMSAHLMAMRGKLFRPTLVLLTSAAAGTPDPSRVPFAAAVELIHLATLVHDDAIDHSVLRRGMPTLNSLYSHQISVIMGDFLYSTALSRLVALGNLEALRALTRASTEMTIGELRQLGASDALDFSEADYFTLIRAKTASLMSAACEIGALCGAEQYRGELRQYGELLGMAFQIVDDVIDYTEAEATTGKPAGLDLREHKVTLPLIAALRAISPAARQKVERLFRDSDPGSDSVREVVEIVSESGGLDQARREARSFAARAESSIENLPDTVARRGLLESISYVMERHA